MPALDPQTRERWRDMVVVDRDAATVGTITMFYLDRATGLPTWALVRTGWLGDRQTFVPLHHATEADGEIRVPYPKARIQEAPAFDPAAELTPDQELALYGHYGLGDHHGAVAERPPAAAGEGRDPRTVAEPPTVAGVPADPAAGPVPSEPPPAATRRAPTPVPPGAGVAVTRSEEELQVGVRTRLRRLRLRKYVVTEYVTRTIPVRREQLRFEELPDAPAGDPSDAEPAGMEAPLELVLHREEPEIRLRVVPVERVRVVKQVVTDHHTVSEPLRKEQVEIDADPTIT
jgi:uncharacterized protein DUF2382/PRC-barrel domain protein